MNVCVRVREDSVRVSIFLARQGSLNTKKPACSCAVHPFCQPAQGMLCHKTRHAPKGPARLVFAPVQLVLHERGGGSPEALPPLHAHPF